MSTLSLISIALTILGSFLVIFGIVRLFQRRLLSAMVLEAPGLLLLSLAAVSFFMATSLHVYQRLDYEQPVAELLFVQTGEKEFSVRLRDIGLEQTNYYQLKGDEWQLDAQIQVWHSYANLLGLDTHYRLHRLSGRYSDIKQEQTALRTVYALYSDNQLNVMESFELVQPWLRWLVDTTYGSAVFLPMTDKALYTVSIGQKGMIVRPANVPAKKAISRWIGL